MGSDSAHMSDLRDATLDALVSADPRGAADRTLAIALSSVQGREAALFTVTDDGAPPSLAYGQSLSGEALATVKVVWAESADRLRAGEDLTGRAWLLAGFPAGDAFGLVYVAGGGAFHPPSAAPTLRSLQRIFAVVLAAQAPAGARDAGRDGRGRPDRIQLLALLEMHEWNVARVGRMVGVTRQTVYKWLDQYSIPREPGKRSGFALRKRAT